jgi:hypothetical protein
MTTAARSNSRLSGGRLILLSAVGLLLTIVSGHAHDNSRLRLS